MEKMPIDPYMLLSVVNLKLRDYYNSLDMMCLEMDINKDEIVSKLKSIEYEYDASKNQFVQDLPVRI